MPRQGPFDNDSAPSRSMPAVVPSCEVPPCVQDTRVPCDEGASSCHRSSTPAASPVSSASYSRLNAASVCTRHRRSLHTAAQLRLEGGGAIGDVRWIRCRLKIDAVPEHDVLQHAVEVCPSRKNAGNLPPAPGCCGRRLTVSDDNVVRPLHVHAAVRWPCGGLWRARPRPPALSVSPTAERQWRDASAAVGRRMMDTYSPAPGGENQLRPFRPRPAVWASATTTVPSAAPARAKSAAMSFVDPATA